MARKRVDDTSQATQKAIMDGEIKIVPIDSIDEWDDNPNKLKEPKGGLKRLCSILKKHGQVTPVTVYTKDNMIRKGNHTRRAMKKNGAKSIRVLFVNFPSIAAANAYGLADNIGSEDTELDFRIVNKMMGSVDFKGIDEDEIQLLTGLNEREMELVRLDDGSFATSNYSDAAAKFEKARKGLDKKKDFWFWFEVDDEKIFEAIKEIYGRTKAKGKRLWRELDADLLVGILLKGVKSGTKKNRQYIRK